MQNDFSSIEFINEIIEEEKVQPKAEKKEEENKAEDDEEEEPEQTQRELTIACKDKRAFTWITMAINEDQLLFFLFN